MYIIPVVICSTVALLLTVYHSRSATKEKTQNQRSAHWDIDALRQIVREIIIVFLSAVVAIWLTSVQQQIEAKNKVEDFAKALVQTSLFSYLEMDWDIREISSQSELAEAELDEQLYDLAQSLAKNDAVFLETMLENENCVSVMRAATYCLLCVDMHQQKTLQEDLLGLDPQRIDRQDVCDQIAEYLYYNMKEPLLVSYLVEDAAAEPPTANSLPEGEFFNNMYYTTYVEDLNMLEATFGVDLSKWKNYDG